MSSPDQSSSSEVVLSRQELVPTIHRFGNREIESTFLGLNAFGQPTWMLWNPLEPYLIGVLRQGDIGFTFEQRTSQGVLVHEEVSLNRVQRALAAGS